MATANPPLDPDESRRLAAVRQRLDRLAEAEGFVPFDQFMEISLYAEEIGFYSRERSPFGPAGDFYTAPQVHPLFGRTLARRLLALRAALGTDRPFSIVEVGPGDGSLAESILTALPRQGRDLRGITYQLVERSTPLARRALERATGVARASGIPVHLEPAVGSTGPFEGVVIANELLDAQPARRLRWNGSEWRELGYRLQSGRLTPAEAPLSAPIPPPELVTPAEPNVVIEISPSAEAWIRSVADQLVRGLLILIDYGLEESELLSAHSRGTLAALRRHRVVERPEEEPGATDLSVFVNFTRIRAAARRAGLVEVADASQAETLGAWGFPEELTSALAAARGAEEEVRIRLAAKNLLFGFERFRVLELAAPLSAGVLPTVKRPDG